MKKNFTSFLVATFFFCFAMESNAQWNLTGNSNAVATSILGTTNAIPLNLTTNNVQRLVIDANGKIGVGIAAPPNIFSVKGSGGIPNPLWVNSGNPLFTGFGEQTVGNADYILSMASSFANARPVFIGRRARGTLAAPTAVATNDQLMSFLCSGYDGGNFQNPATIDFFVDGTPSAGNVPTRISFVTGTNSGNRAERLKIGNTGNITINNNQLFVQQSNGNIGIGNILPQAKMDIAGSIKIADGTQAAGKVLTSDSNGLASWQTVTDPRLGVLSLNSVPRWNGTSFTNGSMTDSAGFVGIGTTSPQARLDVSNGDALINQITIGRGGANDTTNTAIGFRALEINNNFGIKNVAIGYNALKANNGGSFNTAIGSEAMSSVQSGNSDANTAIGKSALSKIQSGFGNVAIGSLALGKGLFPDRNVAVGSGAMANTSTGFANTAIGTNAMSLNISGTNNVAVGSESLYHNQAGSGLVAIGDSALNSLNGGAGRNTAVGKNALYASTIGEDNTAVGHLAIQSATTGSHNTAFGSQALKANTTGGGNIAIGWLPLSANTTGSSNIAIGTLAMAGNSKGSNSVAIGDSALMSSNAIAASNVAIGFSAMKDNTNGNLNTAIGIQALPNNTTGDNNTAIGASALLVNISDNSNTALGFLALGGNTIGSNNVAVGRVALSTNILGANNVAVGASSLSLNKIGTANVAVGTTSGIVIDSSDHCTFVGNAADQSSSALLTNSTALGSQSRVSADNQIRFGNSSITSIGGQVGYTTLSDSRYKTDIQANVPGLQFIKLLQPITYHMDANKLAQDLNEDRTIDKDGKIKNANPGKKTLSSRAKKAAMLMTGFLAQDVEKAAASIGYNFSGVDKPQNDKDMYGLRYAEFVVPLVKAVQELYESQKAEVKSKNEEITALKIKADKIDDLQKQIDELKEALIKLVNQQKCVPTTGK